VRAEGDTRSLRWTKFCHAIGVFGVPALAGAASYDIFARPPLAGAHLSLMAEAAGVASAEQAEIGDFPGLPIAEALRLPADEAVRALGARAGPRPSGPAGGCPERCLRGPLGPP
jgi:hypothetical protein